MQAEVGRVEAVHARLGELWSGHQVAVQVVAPSVVRATDGAAQGAVLGEQFGAPVSTGVQERPQLTRGIAGDDHGSPGHRAHDGAARCVQLVVDTAAHPGGGEPPLLLDVEE